MNQSSEEHAASRGRKDGGSQLLGGCSAVQRHREAQLVVHAFPLAESDCGHLKQLEGMPVPELLGVDAMAALDLAVLLGTTGSDVAMANARPFDRQDEAEGELGPVVGLDLANWKGHGADDLGQEV